MEGGDLVQAVREQVRRVHGIDVLKVTDHSHRCRRFCHPRVEVSCKAQLRSEQHAEVAESADKLHFFPLDSEPPIVSRVGASIAGTHHLRFRDVDADAVLLAPAAVRLR